MDRLHSRNRVLAHELGLKQRQEMEQQKVIQDLQIKIRELQKELDQRFRDVRRKVLDPGSIKKCLPKDDDDNKEEEEEDIIDLEPGEDFWRVVDGI